MNETTNNIDIERMLDFDQQIRLPSGREGDVLAALAECFGLDKEEIKDHTRIHEIARARHVIMYLLREYGGMSFPAIGRLIGNRDHTTVIHGYNKIKTEVEQSPGMVGELQVPIAIAETIKQKKLRIEAKLRELKEKIQFVAKTAKETQRIRSIPERNMRILEMYREGLTLQNMADAFNLSRERVRQIVFGTIERIAINESIAQGIEMDTGVLIEEENRKRRNAQEAKKEAQKPKPKEKRWSAYYSTCRNCGTTAIPHVKHGLCEQCAGSFRGDRRESIIAEHKNRCDRCGIFRPEAIQKYGRDLYLTKDRKVFCKACFRLETGKKLGSYKRYEWSRSYPQCLKCGTTAVPHAGKGLCKNCANVLSSEDRDRVIADHGEKCGRCGISRSKAISTLGRDLSITKNGETLCRKCFQHYRRERSRHADLPDAGRKKFSRR